jgi:hypothetical protein
MHAGTTRNRFGSRFGETNPRCRSATAGASGQVCFATLRIITPFSTPRKQDGPLGHAAPDKAHYIAISISSQLLTAFKCGCDACSQPSTISIAPRRRFPSPGAARSAIPAQQRLGRRPWLHEAVERRRLEAVALAAGEIARRHQRTGRGGGKAGGHQKRDGANEPDHSRAALHLWLRRMLLWTRHHGGRHRTACTRLSAGVNPTTLRARRRSSIQNVSGPPQGPAGDSAAG